MITRRVGDSNVRVSIVGLGGHEYLPDGRSRGFNEEPERSVQPGYIMPSFGGEPRRELLRLCYDRGVNLYDATIDSEKEALGRNLREIPPPFPVYVQTRPEGMVYGRDPYNLKMADCAALRAEVVRSLELLQRDRLDFLNLAFMRDALAHDRAYLDKLARNISRLKEERLIRFATLDTFSGEATYLAGIRECRFDAMYVNLNPADCLALERAIPEATDRGMAVFARECFMKGALFAMGEEVGLTERAHLARVALKWCLTREGVTSAMVGARCAEEMRSDLQALDDLTLSDEDLAVLATLETSPRFREYAARKRQQWQQGP